ncbi:MAG: DUF6365 family protein [Cyanobacteriota bacterium]
MNYIFILFGSDSTYEAQVMSKFLDEMPQGTNVFCFISDIPEVYIKKSENITRIINKSREDNETALNTVIEDGEISAIFIFDFNKVFFTPEYEHEYKTLNFDLRWLEKINAPINIIDSLDFFDYTPDKKIKLRSSGKYNPENYSTNDTEIFTEDTISIKSMKESETNDPNQIKMKRAMFDNKDMLSSRYDFFPNIIKLSPPVDVEPKETAKFLYWNYSNVDYENQDTDMMKGPLGMTDSSKNIFLMFSPAMQMQSILYNKGGHYMRVVEVLIKHLKMLDININLFIGSQAKDPIIDTWVKGTKIKYRAFTSLGYDMYKTMILYCDALITDTSWNPSLLDAACLKKPAGVIGNSFCFNETGDSKSNFDYTNPEIVKILNLSAKNFPQEFFPFTSYPLEEENEIKFGFHDEKYPYYLLDIYNTESVLSFFDEFMIRQEEVSDELNKELHFFSKRGEKALSTSELLNIFTDVN